MASIMIECRHHHRSWSFFKYLRSVIGNFLLSLAAFLHDKSSSQTSPAGNSENHGSVHWFIRIRSDPPECQTWMLFNIRKAYCGRGPQAKESGAGVTDEPEDRRKSKCAIDRSKELVSLSMSIYPCHLQYKPLESRKNYATQQTYTLYLSFVALLSENYHS